jgi:K+-transporting ATPase ATPase C chain
MVKETAQQLKTALSLLALFTVLTGVVYPGVVTIIAHLLFPSQADGSLISVNQKIVGSQLIGQEFTGDNYFWGRASATTPYPYNALSSNASNLGPSNIDLQTAIKARIENIKKMNPDATEKINGAMVTASASGLDPELSLSSAKYQIPRIAHARKIQVEKLEALIESLSQKTILQAFGESRVNVLQLNLALDQLSAGHKS